jgi:chromosome segregation ATPase
LDQSHPEGAHVETQNRNLPSASNNIHFEDPLQATVEQLQRRLEHLSSETSKREDELYQAQKSLGEFSKTIERLQIENEHYKQDLEQERALSIKHEETNLSLRQELTVLREELKAATLANAEMLDETENRTQWEEEITTIRDMLARKELEVKELEDRNALLLEQIDKLESNQQSHTNPSVSKSSSFSKGDLQVIIESHQTMVPSASVTGNMQRSNSARRANDLLDSGRKEKPNALNEPLLEGNTEGFDDSGCCCIII